jgi:catechol 2,3-dioxygenase-like lactoylglutathione lyase family enzyme
VRPVLKSIFLVCRDLETSGRFYQSLGFSQVSKSPRGQVLAAQNELELHLHSELTEQEERDFGVSLGPGSQSLVQSYETTNIEGLAKGFHRETILFGPGLTPWGHKILLLKDPDGHRLEFRESRQSEARDLRA